MPDLGLEPDRAFTLCLRISAADRGALLKELHDILSLIEAEKLKQGFSGSATVSVAFDYRTNPEMTPADWAQKLKAWFSSRPPREHRARSSHSGNVKL
jgi:hypothetical protein